MMDTLSNEWAAQAAADVRELLSRDLAAGADRLDLLVACGRWTVALEPDPDEVEREILRAARGILGRLIDAADNLPDFRGIAETLLNSNASERRPSFSPEEARCYVEERMEAGFALAGLEALWPHEAEELHRYVRKRRGLERHDLALETLHPWQGHAEALALPVTLARFSGLRPLLFGPLAFAVEPWSPLRRALSERRVSVATWHDAASRVLEPRLNGTGREVAVDAALARLLCVAALDPHLARAMVLGRWKALFESPAADTCLAPLSLTAIESGLAVAGGRVLRDCLGSVDRNTVTARALSVAAAAQEWLEQNRRQAAALRFVFAVAALRGLCAASAPWRPAVRAASGGGEPGEPYEHFETDDLKVALTINADERVVASVERAGHPLARVEVTLEHVRPSGERIERARGITDGHGDAVLGPQKDFPRPAAGETYQLVLLLPSGPGASGG